MGASHTRRSTTSGQYDPFKQRGSVTGWARHGLPEVGVGLGGFVSAHGVQPDVRNTAAPRSISADGDACEYELNVPLLMMLPAAS